MTLFEILNFNKELIKRINQAGIRPDDCNFVELYTEYLEMKKKGEKVTYIVTLLSEKYHVSERKTYTIIKRFGMHCN
ncbi:hypothetical protein [Prevotella disiens]|uniref:hypothetical protein n=1 Tax=Prevotella disiens TaxID=28130 RepID=UPI002431D09E|nr:hypothetical protein [Prevotella disiens]